MRSSGGVPIIYGEAYSIAAIASGKGSAIPSISARIMAMIAPVLHIDNTPIDDKETGLRIFDPEEYSVPNGCTLAEEISIMNPVKIILNFEISMPNVTVADLRNISVEYAVGRMGFNMDIIQKIIMCDVREIGDEFLAKSRSLTSIDFSYARSLRRITDNFLVESQVLEEIDLSPLVLLNKIGGSFMMKCPMLRSINMHSLKSVVSVGSSFCMACPALEKLDMSRMSSLRGIDAHFLAHSTSLSELILPSGIRSIDMFFLNGCTSIREIDFSHIDMLENLRTGFLQGCLSLERVRGISALHIGDGVCYGCENLKEIDFSRMQLLESIAGGFLRECKSLESVDLSMATMLNFIGKEFLFGCTSLTSLKLGPSAMSPSFDFTHLSRLDHVSRRFLSGCENLRILDLSGLTRFQIAGDEFLSGCTSLRLINVSMCIRLRTLDLTALGSLPKPLTIMVGPGIKPHTLASPTADDLNIVEPYYDWPISAATLALQRDLWNELIANLDA